MRLEFNPSPELRAKIMQAFKWHEEGATWVEIAKRLGYTRRYVMSLKAWWLEEKEKEKNEK